MSDIEQIFATYPEAMFITIGVANYYYRIYGCYDANTSKSPPNSNPANSNPPA